MDVVQGDMTNLNQDETLGEAESCFLHKLILSSDYPVKNERYKQNKPLRTVIAFGGFVVY